MNGSKLVYFYSVNSTLSILQSIEVPMTMSQLDKLIKMLDKDGDGEIDYA